MIDKRALGFALILSAAIVSGCQTATAEPTVGLANPASVYCEEQGYTLEMRTDADGGQYGVCIFPDGSECEEWAFYRGECRPASEAAEETPTLEPSPVPTEVSEGSTVFS
jgi:putative hemolysin